VSEFDANAETYVDEVQAAIGFSGVEVDLFTRRKAALLLDATTRLLGDPAGLRFLDVGCGVGATDAHLVDHVGSLAAVEVARRDNPGVTYSAYGGSALPQADASIDVAFAICVAHHVPLADRSRFAAELHRVVRPGGLAFVFEHNPWNPLTRVVVNRCEFDEDAILLTRRTSTRLLTSAGFTPAEARYVIFLPIERPLVTRLERYLGWLPLGAQHYVAARR
jgi:SAM-dependent methyltransferase